MISISKNLNKRDIMISNFLRNAALFVGVCGVFAVPVGAQTITVHPGLNGCTGAAALNIAAGGGTADFHVCANTASPATLTCGVGYRLTASASNGSTITARTMGTSFPDRLQADVTFLNGTNNALAPTTSNAGSLVADGVTPIPAANGILVAAFTLTVPAAVPAGTFTVGPTAQLLNITTNTCDGAGASDFTPALPTPLQVIKAGAPVATAPTASLGAAPTLTGGAGTQPVTVLTPGSLTGQLALSCSVGASSAAAAAIAISSGATQTILAGAATATPIGLTCTPQAAAATATLTCTQTPTPAAVLPNLTSTITCPVVVAGVVAYTATPTPLSFTGVTAGTPTANQVVTVAATAGNAAAVNLSACAFGGANAADFSFNPAPTFPVAIAAGGNTTIPVRFTPALANSAARTATLTCQVPNATVAGATSFVITLNGTNPAATPIVVAATTPPGAVTLPGYQPGVAGPGTSSTTLAFSATGGAAALTCTAGGAGYTATPSPLNLAAGATGSVTVTYTGTVAGTFPGTLNCTSTAPATGGPFAYTLSTSVTAFVPPVATVTVPTMGAFGLGLMGLLVAGFGALVQRRRIG
jgi:hypothetical protein